MKKKALPLILALSLTGIALTTSSCGTPEQEEVKKEELSIAFKESSSSLIVGKTLQLEVTVLNNTEELTVTYESSDTKVATVTETGFVTAKKAGTVTITARVGDKSAIKTIEVKNIDATSLELKAPKSVLTVGESIEVTATVLPEDTTIKTVTLKSSDPTILKVEGLKLTALKATGKGKKVTVTGSTHSGKTATLDFTVGEKATGVNITNKEEVVSVGDVLTLGIEFVPENAIPEKYEVTSSVADAVKIEDNKVTMLKEAEAVELTVKTTNNLVAKKTLRINTAGVNAYNTLVADVERSTIAEATNLVSGTQTYSVKDATGKETRRETTTYEVFSNEKANLVKTDLNETVTNYTYGIKGDSLIQYTTRKLKNGEAELQSSSKAIELVDKDATYSQRTKEDAKKIVNLVDLNQNANLKMCGVANKLFTTYINTPNALKKLENQKAAKVTHESANKHTIEASVKAYFNFVDLKFTYEMSESGVMKSYSYTENKYAIDKTTENHKKGELQEVVSISGNIKEGTRRESPAEIVNFDDLYFTDYQIGVFEDDYSSTPLTEVNVGNFMVVKPLSTSTPATASTKFDEIKIKSVSPSTAAEFEGNSINFLEACEALTITTVSSNNIEATVTIKVNQVLPEELTFSQLNPTMLTGSRQIFSIGVFPEEAVVQNIEVTILGDALGATIQDLEGMYELASGTQSGTITIQAKDLDSELTSFTQVNIVANTGVALAEHLSSTVWYDEFGGTEAATFTQTAEEAGIKPTGSFDLNIWSETKEQNINIKGTYEVQVDTEGLITIVTTVTSAPADVTLTEIAFTMGWPSADINSLNIAGSEGETEIWLSLTNTYTEMGMLEY